METEKKKNIGMFSLANCMQIREKLIDLESKKIFDARFQYAFDSDWEQFFQNIKGSQFFFTYDSLNFLKFVQQNQGKKLVIYGMGMFGKYTLSVLREMNVAVYGFGDSEVKKSGEYFQDILLLTDEEIADMLDELFFIVGSNRYVVEVYHKLLCLNVNRNQIWFPFGTYLDVTCGWQYFDFFKPKGNEIFLDAGVFDGMSSVEFVKWCAGIYENIYQFEPNNRNEWKIRRTMAENGIIKYNLVLKGLSDKFGRALFNGRSCSASSVSAFGTDEIELTTIDETLNGAKVTFVKMDIEGKEREALVGAQETIKKYKPRLAISIYHKREDFFVIPKTILDIDSTYQLAIRHYTSSPYESILYAW